MIVNDIIVRKMLKSIYKKINTDKKLSKQEINLLNSLITLTVEDLGGKINADSGTGGKEKA